MPCKVNKGNRTVWRASKMVDGQRRQKDCATKADALAWEKSFEKEMRSPEEKLTDMDLRDLYRQYLRFGEPRFHPRTYTEKFKLCEDTLDFWGTIPISQVTRAMVLEYIDERARLVSNNTANRDLKNLKAMFTWGEEMLELTYNPARGIKPMPHEAKRRYVPPREDVLRIIAAADPIDRVMLVCFLNTGARRSEIFGLRWDDVDFAKSKITLTTCKTKNGSPRRDTLDMSDELHQSLLSWKESTQRRFKNRPYVFVCQQAGPGLGKPYTTRRKFMRGLCKRAGVKPFGFHALRHHVASYLADHHGISTLKIKELLRHQAVSTTERYIQRLGGNLKDTVDLLRTDENLLPDLLPKEKEGQR